MQLRDPDAAALLALMQARHRDALLLDASAPPPVPTGFGPQPHGGPGGQAPFDYAAWCAEVAQLVAAGPVDTAMLAERYGVTRKSIQSRLQKSRRDGHWPPKGMREVRVRSNYTAPRITLVPS
jgi:hypothetical protein